MAGPNGSGKSTFGESFLLRAKGNDIFLNADRVAAGIAPHDVQKAAFQAGRFLIQEVKRNISEGKSFGFESTLSGKTWAIILDQARSQDYEITIYFLFLKSVKGNLKRIKQRVRTGGHLVPYRDVIRRYPRCFANFWNLYRPLCADWHIFDNSAKHPAPFCDKTAYDKLSLDEQQAFATKFLERSRT